MKSSVFWGLAQRAGASDRDAEALIWHYSFHFSCNLLIRRRLTLKTVSGENAMAAFLQVIAARAMSDNAQGC
jgi:hypothetical protein